MNILFVSDNCPQRHEGGAVCTAAHMEAVAALGDAVGKAFFIFFSEDTVEEELGRVIYVPTGILHRKVVPALLGWNPRMHAGVRRTITDAVDNLNIDMVFIDSSLHGQFVRMLKRTRPHLTVTAFFHNIEAVKMRADRGFSFWRRLALPVSLRNERLTAQWADRCLVLCRRDARLFHQVYNREPFAIIPMGVKMPDSINTEGTHHAGDVLSLLFVGGTYPPNVHSMLWFLDDVLPLVRSAVRVVVAGRGTEQLLSLYRRAATVEVVGTVDNLAPYYASADVVIVPVIEGGGMKTKTAEALSYGKRVVGTTEGLEGYMEFVPATMIDSSVFLCHDATSFAAAIDSLANTSFNKYDARCRNIAETFFSTAAVLNNITKALLPEG